MDLGQLHVRENLCFMNADECVDAFNFYDDFIFYQQINAIITIQLNSFILNGQNLLLFKINSF